LNERSIIFSGDLASGFSGVTVGTEDSFSPPLAYLSVVVGIDPSNFASLIQVARQRNLRCSAVILGSGPRMKERW
jgi:hypothetical protein